MTGGAPFRNPHNLPVKDCVVCGRPFTWRKKWERCWDEVQTCSNRCRTARRVKSSAGKKLAGGMAAGAAAAITSADRAAKSEDSEATPDEVVDDPDPVTRSEEPGESPATSRGYAGDQAEQVSLSLEQLTSDEEPGGKSSEAQDVKAARSERKKALKAERRARRAQSPEERAAAKRKPCTLCQRPVDLLVRCRIDISQKWHMLCGRCWKKESGGVPDGDASHPHYRYGGLWKNRSAKVTTPSFSGAVKAKEDFDSAERLLQEAYKGG